MTHPRMNHEGHEERQSHEGHEEARGRREALAAHVVNMGLRIHKALGPGLMESAYEQCLAHALDRSGVDVARQVALPIMYDGITIDGGYRIDMLIGGEIIIEVKAVDVVTSLHQAQLLTYLKLSGCRIGFLMNFNVELFKQGVKRLGLSQIRIGSRMVECT